MNAEYLEPEPWPGGAPQEAVLYVYDALCGWCYGMGPHIRALRDSFPDLPFCILSGGMVPASVAANRQPAAMADYIRSASRRITEMAGVYFGEPFLDGVLSQQDSRYDSDVPGTVLAWVKSQQQTAALDFAGEMQAAFFQEGQSLNSPDTYTPLLKRFGLDADSFALDGMGYVAQAQYLRERDFVSRLGITGFPAVLYRNGERYWLIARGFRPVHELRDILPAVRQEAAETPA